MRPRSNSFLMLWVAVVVASTSALSVYLTLRVRAIEMGYELGQSHATLGRLREVKRVLELEAASYETPERVELVARTLFGMRRPGPERLLSAGPLPEVPVVEQELARAEHGR